MQDGDLSQGLAADAAEAGAAFGGAHAWRRRMPLLFESPRQH
jgi:hypothetical protein